jgi:hypothetical protein
MAIQTDLWVGLTIGTKMISTKVCTSEYLILRTDVLYLYDTESI